MKYCPDCGTGHECDSQPAGANPDVEIARIQARRDIEVAKIERGNLNAELEAETEIAAIEAEAAVEEAEAVAETIGTVLAADQPAEPEPEPSEPIIVQDSAPTEDELPPRDERDHQSHDRPPAKKTGFF